MEVRPWAVALGLWATTCASRPRAVPSVAPVATPAIATPEDAVRVDPAQALRAAEEALEAGRLAQAITRFGQVLGADPGPDELRQAYLGLAGAYEQLKDCVGVLRTIDALVARFPGAPDRVALEARRGACHAELGQWEASAASFAAVAVASGQLPSTRIEALARQGFALFRLDRFDEADRVLLRADEIFDQAQRDQSERFSTYYFVGMARFYRAAILHRRFREVAITLPETVMAKAFKRKVELLTAAQEAYNHTIKAKHVFWVSAAGFQLGQLFSEFYDALMYAPVPDWLDEHQLQIYYAELKKQLSPVIDRAIWVLEKNLEVARRLGYENEFTSQTQTKLARLQGVLATQGSDLGIPGPRLSPEEAQDVGPPPVLGTGPERRLFVPPMTSLQP